MQGEWTTILATYAAIVSTSGVIWNVYSWHKARSVDLRGHATPKIIVIGVEPHPDVEGKEFISVSVANHGTVTCYVEALHILAFDNWLAVKRCKPSFAAISMDDLSASLTGKKLPFKLEPAPGTQDSSRKRHRLSNSRARKCCSSSCTTRFRAADIFCAYGQSKRTRKTPLTWHQSRAERRACDASMPKTGISCVDTQPTGICFHAKTLPPSGRWAATEAPTAWAGVRRR